MFERLSDKALEERIAIMSDKMVFARGNVAYGVLHFSIEC